PSSFRLGNLFLSSCPGKKVRLTGAVRGRGAVCRDLAIDLQRFKSLGVGALVCCLSDAELGVIGVQWEEYMKEAAKLGLDLVRVPMVEGNCPTSQEYLDAWLEEIVYHCTLKGVNVLVHCRGGVGRAGTIAACWLAKMGLVDEFRPPNEVARRGKVLPAQELLWQCLQVVRMRRSSKAIETAEQAAYIAKYGEYL
ncbi:phosphatases II, partial [Microstroma glucosiphilum]